MNRAGEQEMVFQLTPDHDLHRWSFTVFVKTTASTGTLLPAVPFLSTLMHHYFLAKKLHLFYSLSGIKHFTHLPPGLGLSCPLILLLFHPALCCVLQFTRMLIEFLPYARLSAELL